MSTFESRALLAESDRLKRKASGDQRLSSVPLFAFAVIVGVGSTLDYAATHGPAGFSFVARTGSLWSQVFYVVAVPLVLLGVYFAQRRRAQRLGATPMGGRSAGLALVLIPLVVALFVPSGLGRWGSVGAAAGILVAALIQRNWFLAVWISVLEAVALLLDDYFWVNRLYELRHWLSSHQDPQYGYAEAAQYVAVAGVVLIVVGVGVWASRRERVR